MRKIINKKKIRNNFIVKLLTIIFFMMTIIILLNWLVNSKSNTNLLSRYIEDISEKYEFVLTEVEINGLENISQDEINQYFLEFYDKSIFLLPLEKISKKIEQNRWIKSVLIKNNFRNKISIKLIELVPIAVYFDGKNYELIDELGQFIDFADNNEIKKYILLTGKNAKDQAVSFLEVIPSDLKLIIQKAEYINNRRWNVYLINNLKLKLPEKDYKNAMKNFVEIYDNLSISDISTINYFDLRISERVIIKLDKND